MTIRELKNLLNNYDEGMEFLIAEGDSLYQLSPSSFREVTLMETSTNDLVDSTDYNPEKDGRVIQTREVVIADAEE